MSTLLRVVKVGGSLFALPDLAARLEKWHAQQPQGVTVFIAGLGEIGDCLREYDARFGLPTEQSHMMCLEALAVSARLLHALLQPQAVWTEDWQALARRHFSEGEQRVYVFSPSKFLLTLEPQQPGDALPIGWDVTSDSIAARVAELLHADDLVLVKSKLPEPFTLVAELADQEYVDRYFPWAMRSMGEVRLVNLCDEAFPQVYAFE
jgi:aspartokinase-like uncharacterized kinase